MKVSSYKDLVATPQAHVEFLRHVVELSKGVDADEPDPARKLYSTMRDSIDVGGTPFSQARHLHVLEDASDSWDVEATSPDVLREIWTLSEQVQEFDPGYKICDFTVGYQWLKDLAGDSEIAPPR